jgi:hypothetical protein
MEPLAACPADVSGVLGSVVSLTVCEPTVVVICWLLVTGVPSTKSGKSPGCLVPPPVLSTTFCTVSLGALKVLVMVQVLTSPAASVMEPLAAQAPPMTAV